jgi:addiction module HigA family antidote
MTTIRTEDLDTIDFSDVTTGNAIRPIHPGEILREEFLAPLGMATADLAHALKVPLPVIDGLMQEKSPVTPDTALRLARYFGSSPQFWLNLQTAYDLRVAKQHASAVIEREVAPRAAA